MSSRCTGTRAWPWRPQHLPEDLALASRQVWDDALVFGRQYGFRNAQTTVLAPTGTIGLLMDCDTTGIEPDFSLVKFKKLAGGGYFKIVNQSVERALEALGYPPAQIQEILKYTLGTCTLSGTPHINPASLKAKGLLEEESGEGGEPALPRGGSAPGLLGLRPGRRVPDAPRRRPR